MPPGDLVEEGRRADRAGGRRMTAKTHGEQRGPACRCTWSRWQSASPISTICAAFARSASRERGGSWVYTRNHPRRAEAVLDGGSIYWVIRGQVRVRQRVTGFRSERDDKGRAYCLIRVDPELVRDLATGVSAVSGLALSAAGRCAADAPGGPAATSRRCPTACWRNCASSG